jgi:hypothetical protein
MGQLMCYRSPTRCTRLSRPHVQKDFLPDAEESVPAIPGAVLERCGASLGRRSSLCARGGGQTCREINSCPYLIGTTTDRPEL